MNIISQLTEADLAEAFAIEKASHTLPWSENTFYSNQGARYLNLKLSRNDNIIGFAITQIILDEATLFNIAIHPRFQRQGLAKKLLQCLIQQLTEKKITTLWLEVRASNSGAIALYQSFGFNEVSVRANYYPATQGQAREDAIIMALILN